MSGVLTLPETDERLVHASSAGLTTDGKQTRRQGLPSPNVLNALVGDARRDEAFRQCIRQIDSYRSLPQDWDTYGGLGASDRSAAFATSLVDRLRWLPEISAPYVCPISTGVYLEWRSAHMNLYFEIDEDSVLFVMHQGDVVVEDGEDAAFDVRRAVELVQRFHRSAF